jgi:NADH-quinone oxidoreductase subunit N
MQTPDLVPVIPELILLVAACLVLIVEPFLKPGTDGKTDRTAIIAITLVGLVASIVVSLAYTGENRVSFAGMMVLSNWAIFFKVLFAAGGILTVLMSSSYLEAHRRHLGEYYALILFAIIGMDLMAASRDFILLWVSLELKYFLTGSFASAIMVYGISLVYGEAGATNYAAVGKVLSGQGGTAGILLAVFLFAIGLTFKVSAAPFHQWVPDVYQGAPTPIAGFFSVGPKAAGFSAFIVSFILAFPGAVHDWGIFFIVLAILTMLAGNLYALVQSNVKRMLAYSSIAHAGYLLTGLAAMGWSANSYPDRSILVYLAAYTFTNLGAFGILVYLKTQMPEKFDYSLKQLAGLGRRSPWAALLFSLFLLSLAGIPGTAGFIAKFYLFGGVVWANLWWLAVIGVVLSAVSAYYYLRVIMYMFFRDPEDDYAVREPINGGMAAALGVCAFATVAIGVAPQWLWDSAVSAVTTLFR